ncbi:MAG: phosphoribosylformylglycinamidine synthase subunit PurQ [Alphaproteobacteria bacterium]
MSAAVIVFPGSNCDRDMAVALEATLGRAPQMVWHGDSELPNVDLIAVPGGFSYGDYLRSGAMAANSPIMREVVAQAGRGVPVLGICNGFQVLTECGLLPGILMRNASLKFICRDVDLRVERNDTIFTRDYGAGDVIRVPVAHHDGNYFADPDTLKSLEDDGRVAFRYCTPEGAVTDAASPNGSLNNIAGILSEAGNVLGMMPHPERLADPLLGGTDGAPMFTALAEAIAA